MFEILDENTLSENCRKRLEKHGSSISDDNIRLLIQRIEDYPEIIEAVHLRDVRAHRTRPEFDPKLGGD